MPYGTVPPEVERQLRRQRLLEALAAMAGGVGTGRMGSAMLQGVAGAERGYQAGIADYLDQQMRQEREERLLAREERYEAQEAAREAREAESRTGEDAALRALSERLSALGGGDPAVAAQVEAGVQTRDVGGLSRLLGGLEERRKMMALGINPDDPASRQRYLIEQGVDRDPNARLPQQPRQPAQPQLRIVNGVPMVWDPETRSLGPVAGDVPPRPDDAGADVQKEVERMVLRGEIAPAAAPEEIARRTRELQAVRQNVAAGGAGVPIDIEAMGASGAGRVRVAPQQRVIGTSEGPASGAAQEPVLVAVLARYPQADQEFDINAMRKAGYTDQEIARLLEQHYGAGGG